MASFILAAPWLPPIIIIVSLFALNPVSCSAINSSPLNKSGRIIAPIEDDFSAGRYFNVSSKVVNMCFAKELAILFESPGVISDS